MWVGCFCFFSSRRRHTICGLVTGVQTCSLPIFAEGDRFIIEDLGIHILDVARFVMGEAATLTCRTQRVNPAVRGEDVATILLGHTSGATSVVDCSYATPVHDELFPQTLIEVDGDKGRLRQIGRAHV